jgi:hypothetical protein
MDYETYYNSEDRGWSHLCPECSTEFFGRKNRVYCGDGCKNIKNNTLGAARLNQKLGLVRDLQINDQVLAKLYKRSPSHRTTMQEMSAAGFNLESHFAQMTSDNGIEYRRAIDYLFNVANDIITIHKV